METMVQTAPTCTCGKALTFDSEIKSWRCFSCVPVDPNTPICKTQMCKRPLTYLEKQGCWRCLKCNPIVEVRPTEKIKPKYIDVTMTEDRVSEKIAEMKKSLMSGIGDIVREAMSEFSLKGDDPDYPPSPKEIKQIAETVSVGGDTITTSESKELNWRQQAKRLGIRTSQRMKVDVLAEIAGKTSTSPEGDDTLRPQGQEQN